jgi:hypothetical protein
MGRQRGRLDRRLVAYSGAAAAALAFGSQAEATPVYYEGPWSGGGRGQTHISFNLDGDVLTGGARVADEQFYFVNRFAESKFGRDTMDMEGIRPIGAAAVFHNDALSAVPLGMGDIVGPSTHTPVPERTKSGDQQYAFELYGTSSGVYKGQFYPGMRAFLGLRFDGPGDDLYYGWADITLQTKEWVTLHGYAYEDSGGPIVAGDTGLGPTDGAIPEPSTLALLALGAAGLAIMRGRKKRAEVC